MGVAKHAVGHTSIGIFTDLNMKGGGARGYWMILNEMKPQFINFIMYSIEIFKMSVWNLDFFQFFSLF